MSRTKFYKSWLFFPLLFISLMSWAQEFPDFYSVKDDVRLMKYVNQASTSGEGKDGWTAKGIYKKGQLVKLIGFFRGKVQSIEKYRYTDGRSLRTVFKRSRTGRYKIYKELKFSDTMLKKVVFHLEEDTNLKRIIHENILTDEHGRVVNFNSIYETTRDTFLNGGETTIEYSQDSIVQSKLYNNGKSFNKKVYLLDDKKNPVITYLLLNNDLQDDAPIAKTSHQRYVFDERGNWVEMYHVDDEGNQTLHFTRTIVYR